MFIDREFVSAQRQGTAIDFSSRVAAMKEGTALYPDPWDRESEEPFVVTKLPAIAPRPDIISPGFDVKRAGSSVIVLPRCFNFAASAAEAVGNDLLQVRGPRAFLESHILLVLGCTDVSPGRALITNFAHWHNHIAHSIDLAYAFSNTLPTEFLMEDGSVEVPPENSLVRFGRRAMHRSPVNEGEETLRRIFGGFIVYPRARASRNGEPQNVPLIRFEEGGRLAGAFKSSATLALKAAKAHGYEPVGQRLAPQPVAFVA